MHVFGLTGGLGSGKSTVATWFRQWGVPVVDADQLAREVVAAGTPGLSAVVEAFGAEVLDTKGELDRRRLGALVFGNPGRLQRLNALLHPRISARLAEMLRDLRQQGHPLACYEAALIVEKGLADRYRPLVAVSISPVLQRARALLRDGLSEAEIDARLASQLPDAERCAVADYVIRNDQDLTSLRTSALAVLQAIRAGLTDPPMSRA